MDIWSYVGIYVLIAGAVSLTSYFNLYLPAVTLLEEILEGRAKGYRGILGSSIFIVTAFVMAPWVALMLLSNNNKRYIAKYALAMAERHTEDE